MQRLLHMCTSATCTLLLWMAWKVLLRTESFVCLLASAETCQSAHCSPQMLLPCCLSTWYQLSSAKAAVQGLQCSTYNSAFIREEEASQCCPCIQTAQSALKSPTRYVIAATHNSTFTMSTAILNEVGREQRMVWKPVTDGWLCIAWLARSAAQPDVSTPKRLDADMWRARHANHVANIAAERVFCWWWSLVIMMEQHTMATIVSTATLSRQQKLQRW